MKAFRVVLSVAAFIAVLAVACGGQDSATTGATGENTPAPPTSDTSSPPPATAIPAPTEAPPSASFSVDSKSSSAPLIANFSNLSQGSITSVEWDFGDGTTSSDESPSHRYVISGTFDVQLTVSGPGGNDKSVMSDLIDIKPGPVVSLEVSPPDSALSVQESVQFTAMARDEFGNAVPSAFDWVTDQDGGSITENGLFTAGRETGIFTDIVSVSLQGSSGELTRKSSVTVTPGAVSRVVVEPPSVTLGVDDIRSFSFKSFDAFDNETTDVIINWKVPPEVGTIGANGLFTAGTVAGRFNGALSMEAVGGTARASASVDVIILPDILVTIEVKPANVFVNGGG